MERIYVIWTTFDGVQVAIIDTKADLKEMLDNYPEVNWLDDPVMFRWEQAFNGFMIKGGGIFTP